MKPEDVTLCVVRTKKEEFELVRQRRSGALALLHVLHGRNEQRIPTRITTRVQSGALVHASAVTACAQELILRHERETRARTTLIAAALEETWEGGASILVDVAEWTAVKARSVIEDDADTELTLDAARSLVLELKCALLELARSYDDGDTTDADEYAADVLANKEARTWNS